MSLLALPLGYRILWGSLAMAIATLRATLVVALHLRLRVGGLVGYYITSARLAGEAITLSPISSNVAGYAFPPAIFRCSCIVTDLIYSL